MEPGVRVSSTALFCSPVSPRAGRRFAAATLEAWGPDGLLEDVSLCVTELVTNAVLHAATDAGLTLHEDGTQLVIEVRDRRPGPLAVPAPHTPPPPVDGMTGRGLFVVAALVDEF